MTLEYHNYLAHHGIKGQKWGVRRYQNEDGSLTEAGKKYYGKKLNKDIRKNWWKINNEAADEFNKNVGKINAKYDNVNDLWDESAIASEKSLNYLKEINDLHQSAQRKAAQKFFKDNPAYTDAALSMIPTYNMYSNEYNRIVDRNKRLKEK